MRSLVVWLITKYKKYISPLFKYFFGGGCRFTPTCSQYTIEAVTKFGVIKGLFFGTKRVIRCNPWGGSGYDPLE